MKKTLLALALFAALVLTTSAQAQTWTKALDAITTSTNSAFIPTGGTNNLEVLVYSASTSTSSIPIKVCATAAAATCYAVSTVSNVSSTPVYLNGPAGKYLYVPATVSAGTVTVYYSTNNGPRLPGWKTFDQYGVATSATGTIAVAAGKSAAISNSLTLAGTDSTTMTFPGTNATVARTDAAQTFTGAQTFSSPIVGALKTTSNAYATDGAITVAPQIALLTKAGVGAYTLAAPTATTHDGYQLCAVSTTANAHVITFASGKINGGSNTKITYGGAIGDAACLVAYQGVWYSTSLINGTVAP